MHDYKLDYLWKIIYFLKKIYLNYIFNNSTSINYQQDYLVYFSFELISKLSLSDTYN